MKVGIWVTLARAGIVMVLGSVLLFFPDRTRPFLVNSMGMFWLAAGLVSLRRSLADGQERGLLLVAGVVGALMGAAVLVRSVAFSYGPDVAVIYMLATLMLLTGILHILRGYRSRKPHGRVWAAESFFLGVVEIGLALLLFITPLERGQLLHILLALWALIGGLTLISQAFFMLRQSRQVPVPPRS